MIENLAKSNPQIAQAIPIVKEIIAGGGTKREQLQKACQKSGVNPQQAEEQLSKLGINL